MSAASNLLNGTTLLQVRAGDTAACATMEDLKQIWSWNSTVPATSNVCVHDLISATARRQPQALAVHAWDGDFTYHDVESLSERLSQRLLSQYGDLKSRVIPMLFEKSKWTVVARLAVMKTGAASLALDPTQPKDRLRSILVQVSPAAILTSSACQALARELADEHASGYVVPINQAFFAQYQAVPDYQNCHVSPSDILYIVFTSGSTGIPKGVIVTHSNFSSAIHHQKSSHGLTSQSRVFDFSAYTFDVSWANVLNSLSSGACLCVPSDKERKDDLAGVMKRMRATFAELTPSAARVLPLDIIRSLETLILTGERLRREDAERWAPLVNTKNFYGPCECTVTSTGIDLGPGRQYHDSIGRGLGCNTWVVSPEDGDLAAIGSIGELLLEGPIVGPGYHGDAEKTAAAFINDPAWLLRGAPGRTGRHGRVYKTGDLVRYESNGNLTFVGRKDAQVKINGQRMELTEIENHIGRLPALRQSACLLPDRGPCEGKVVCVFSLQSFEFDFEHAAEAVKLLPYEYESVVKQHVESLQSLLSESLPSYMIPSIWIAVENIPTNMSHKLDYRIVRTWLNEMTTKTFLKVSKLETDDAFRLPESEGERLIRDMTSQALGRTIEMIDIDRSFVANGGDSIAAMHMSSLCRSITTSFSVSSLLKSSSLAAFSQDMFLSTKTAERTQKESNAQFGLSPIQRWFFGQLPLGQKHNSGQLYCNQGFYVKIKKPVALQRISAAIARVVQRHSMLRARFSEENGTWTQRISQAGRYHFGSSHLEDIQELELLASQRHQMLDIEDGPVFAAESCTLTDGTQALVMVASHLVIDLVSWRIILDDLQTLLGGGTLHDDEVSYKTWVDVQTKRVQSADFDASRALSTKGVSNDLEFWGFTQATPNSQRDHDVKHILVDKRTTDILLKDANKAFNTEPVDILLAAVWDAFFHTFRDRQDLTVFSEGHGREPWSDDVEPYGTVGWFTTMSPIHVTRNATTSLLEAVKIIKDARRRLPANGWVYFASRYLDNDTSNLFQNHGSTMEVVLNYHGQFQQLEDEKSIFQNLPVSNIAEVGADLPASSLFNIEVSIQGGKAFFEFSFNRHITHQKLIREWGLQIAPSLENICGELKSAKASSTLCDYKYISLDYPGLDDLQNRVIPQIELAHGTTVEEIIMCSPMVNGILMTQVTRPDLYKTEEMIELGYRKPMSLETGALAAAWQKVVARQPALRTVFVEGYDASSAFCQIILSSFQGEIMLLQGQDKAEALEKIKALTPTQYQQSCPPHRLALCQSMVCGTVFCRLEISHAITDGASTNVLLSDWASALLDTLPQDNLLETSRGFAQNLRAMNPVKKTAYWTGKLGSLQSCQFPRLSNAGHTKSKWSLAERKIGGIAFERIQQFCTSQSLTPASVFLSAWSLTVAAYTGTDSTCFGYLTSGRDIPVQNIEQSAGAYLNMLICRADRTKFSSGSTFVRQMYEQVLADMEHQHCSLADVQHELGLSPGQSLFNTIVSFQRKNDDDYRLRSSSMPLSFTHLGAEDPTEYDLCLGIQHGTKDVELCLRCNEKHLSEAQASRVLSLLTSTIDQLIHGELVASSTSTSPERYSKPAGIEEISHEDRQDIWSWNHDVSESVDKCVHELIAEITRKQPQASAVCAWDGQWTYSELDARSTRLAHLLVGSGVGPGVVVPLLFEKSKWEPVAALAVMKAGGASVTLDPNLPADRLRTITTQVHSTVALSSVAFEVVAKKVVHCQVVTVDGTCFVGSLSTQNQLPILRPADTLYICFTSGSTGKPKGVIITHSNFASAVRYQQKILGLNVQSRVLDFASYMFDVSWCNLLQTLTAGGCLCVPSEDARKNDFIGASESLSANVAMLTPSTLRCAEVKRLRTLKEIIFLGEALVAEDIEHIPPGINVSNVYGPTECTPLSIFHKIRASDGADAATIGKGAGVNCWIVQPSDHTKLAPIGSTGELLLEGPLVAAGYYHDAEKTSVAFIEDPPWLLQGTDAFPGRRGRLYKTGDLVRYSDTDGTLTYVGRRDAQVKINGQRVELGDIEHQIRACLPNDGSVQITTEVVKPDGVSRTLLVAFLSITRILPRDELSIEDRQRHAKEVVSAIIDKLSSQLPAYMIPAAFLTLEDMPLTPSGKIDRQGLRNWASKLSMAELTASDMSRSKLRRPETPLERQLQALWALVLEVQPDQIGADDGFLRVGGDSVRAMRLVGLARNQGLSLTVADIFKHPRLCDMAKTITETVAGEEEVIRPFALLKPGAQAEHTRQAAATLCNLDAGQIEDVFPCTPLQEGLLALTAKRSGDFVLREALEIEATVDIDRFRRAWESVVEITPILRTRVVDMHGRGLMQVVVRHEARWVSGASNELDKKMGLGTDLMHYELEHNADKRFFVLTIHHALYDGWSMSLIHDRLSRAYQGEAQQPSPPFQRFVKHVMSIREIQASKFWRQQFEGLEAQAFPALPSPTYEPHPNRIVVHEVSDLHWPKSSYTASTIVRAAWSILATHYTDASDVCFGVMVTGRQAAVPEVEQMAGPAIATVPLRVNLDRNATVEEVLHQIQIQATDMITYEQTGLQKIQRMGVDAERACHFQSLLIVQPRGQGSRSNLFAGGNNKSREESGKQAANFDTYAMTLECNLMDDGITIKAIFDDEVIGQDQVERMSQQLEHILRQLCDPQNGNTRLANVEAVTKSDLDRIWSWNSTVPDASSACIHELVAEVSQRQPQKVAICAWDGELTYEELDRLSTCLAQRLIVGFRNKASNEINNSDQNSFARVVPLLFEKSKWTPVAMLAVMKAGAASLAVDPGQPEERLGAIFEQIKPRTVLASTCYSGLAKRLGAEEVLAVNEAYFMQMSSQSLPELSLPKVEPSNPLYIIFTSGSTGTPKGVVITHSNYCSAIAHQQEAHGFRADSRVYDFASYAFDVAWSNMLHTLTVGACLCVPSDTERKDDLAKSVERFQATHLDITPSVAATLPESAFQRLETVVLGGEALQAGHAKAWASLVTLKNPYGPSECTPTATLLTVDPEAPFNGSIGKGIGLNTWIVDPSASDRLMPIGCIGELLLEGPLVGPGYYQNPEKTAAAFVQDPPWLTQGPPKALDCIAKSGRRGILYKTGDLVKYAEDGSLTFVGRKDAQVKINGQRVELGDVEHHVRSNLHSDIDAQVAAEVVVPQGKTRAMLMAFFGMTGQGSVDLEELSSKTAQLEETLAAKVPTYMVPAVYVPLESLPMTATGKIDRRQLREIGAKVKLEERASRANAERRTPSTPMERQLQSLWSSVLGVDSETIGLDDSFLRIGGDSIAAMRMVKAAREKGVWLTVAGVLRNPRLLTMAATAKLADDVKATKPSAYEPFSMLPPSTREEIVSACAKYHGIAKTNILDAMPVTDQQARLVTMTYCSMRSNLLYHTLDCTGVADLNKIREIYRSLLGRFDMMRTVFIPHASSLLQIVLKKVELEFAFLENGRMTLDEKTEELRLKDMKSPLRFGDQLTSFAVIGNMAEQKYRLVVRMSHAQHDGMSIAKMWNTVEEALDGQMNPSNNAEISFSQHMYALYRADKGAARAYWRDLLAGSSMTDLKTRTHHATSHGDVHCIKKTIQSADLPSSDFTFATVLKAAWAYVLAQNAATDDVLFGALTHGRTQQSGQDVFGACVSVVPVRARFAAGWRVRDHIGDINSQQLASLAYEHIGPREIVRTCTDWPTWGFFGSVVHVQNFDSEERGGRVRNMHGESPEVALCNVDDVQAHITAYPSDAGGAQIIVSFAAGTVPRDVAESLAQSLFDTVAAFHQDLDATLASPVELRELPALLPLAAGRSHDFHKMWEDVAPAEVREALLAAWAAVFVHESIEAADLPSKTFLDLGGDLVTAGLVSANMQRRGFWLSVDDILEQPAFERQLHMVRQRIA